MTHYSVNFNLNISGGNKNWTSTYNQGGITNSASNQLDAWDSRRGGRRLGLDCDWSDGRGVAAGRPMGAQAGNWSPMGQGGI